MWWAMEVFYEETERDPPKSSSKVTFKPFNSNSLLYFVLFQCILYHSLILSLAVAMALTMVVATPFPSPSPSSSSSSSFCSSPPLTNWWHFLNNWYFMSQNTLKLIKTKQLPYWVNKFHILLWSSIIVLSTPWVKCKMSSR